MDKKQKAQALRDDAQVHYNCCQAVIMTFAEECGLSAGQVMALGAHFGSGMRHGGTCGAVAGALMVLGMAGKGERAANGLLNAFRGENTYLDCAHLLQKAAQEGEERKPHCDRMVAQAVELADTLLREKKED